MDTVVAIDIGGTAIKTSLVHVDGGAFLSLDDVANYRLKGNEFGELVSIVLEDVERRVRVSEDLSLVGVSTTGSVAPSGRVISAGHFEGYKDVSWSELLMPVSPRIRHVVTANDGRSSAWAEYCSITPRPLAYAHVVVGTGVGGGVIYAGDLMSGDSGQAGYLGHIKVTADRTRICSCGCEGCAETLASARAIVGEYTSRLPGRAPGSDVTLEQIVDLAAGGDEEALEIMTKAGWWLGRALGSAMNVINPAVVTVGGGVALASGEIGEHGGPYMAGVRAGVKSAAHRRVAATAEVRLAVHGNDGGMIGAALLAAGC